MATLTAGSTRVTVDSTGTWYAIANTTSVGNANTGGGVFLIKYTKGSESGYSFSLNKIYPLSSTTDVYQTPTTIHGPLAQVSATASASGNWELPVPAIAHGQIKLVMAVTGGSTNGTTAITVDFIRDSEDGR